MRIAVELNNIVRDYNSQVLKYYLKGYNPSFDDETVDLKCTDIMNVLPFKSKAEKKTFKEIDYPYELFGCARPVSKHLHVNLSDWLEDNPNVEVIYFTIGESDLMIQSTYFFLSKGSRVKTMMFLKEPKEIWDFCDVVVTLNKEIVESKPNDKKVIVIKRSDNEDLQKQADACYTKFIDMLSDEELKNKLILSNKKTSYIKKIKNKINKLWMK